MARVTPISENGTKVSGTLHSKIRPCATRTAMANAVIVNSWGAITPSTDPRHTNNMRNQCRRGRTIITNSRMKKPATRGRFSVDADQPG